MFFHGIAIPIDYWFAIGELLLMINKHPATGTIDSLERFKVLLEATKEWSRLQRQLEDVRTKRVVIGRTKSGLKAVILKFAQAMTENQKAFGMLSSMNLQEQTVMFPYMNLESAATPDAALAESTDWAEIFATFWPTSLQLRYLLQGHHRTMKQYNYLPDALDMTILAGWCMQIWGQEGLSTIKSENELNELEAIQKHIEQYSPGPRTVQAFVRDYIDSTELVPIVGRTSEGFVLDHFTLFFFMLYLQGCPEPTYPGAVTRGDSLIDRMRQSTGEKFEAWLRSEVRTRGYNGPGDAVQETYEYDIIAISEAKSLIVLADAKYRDVAPSSFTGTNLVSQELLGDHALRHEANRQQERLDYFRNNLGLFKQHLSPQRPWPEYEVRSYLITKHIPLAHRYKETRILRALEFLESEL